MGTHRGIIKAATTLKNEKIILGTRCSNLDWIPVESTSEKVAFKMRPD